MNNAKLYLCKADCSILGSIGGIKEETFSLTRNALDLWEITFEVERFIDKNGKLIQSNYYDSIDEMMRLYLDSETVQAFFVIDSEPTIGGENLHEIKSVTAHSIECELGNVYLKNFKVNCGTNDSQEYLVKYSIPREIKDENGNVLYTIENNINPYTNLPYEYISLVNYKYPELSMMHMILDGTGWTIADNIPSDICHIKNSYDTSESVYAFLMKQVSSTASVIFDFDRKYKKINIIPIEKYGNDTGVFITMRNLMNSFEVTSSSEDNIVTKFIPTGANDLGILYANFGEDYIINLDYFMNTLNEYGDYKYVSKELRDKYTIWKNYRDVDKPYTDSNLTRREKYRELSKLYNKTILDIGELKNRVPNDGVIIDYKTFSLEDLKTSLKAYENALFALITIYKNEYNVIDIGESPDYLPTPSSSTNIKNTPYWYDFYAYKEKIIPQVTEALKMYCKTDENGNLVTDSEGNYVELEYGNPAYYTDETIVKNIDSYLYEWSLYGLDELEAKKKAWGEVSSVLFKEYYIATKDDNGNVTSYITPDAWDSLGVYQLDFTSKEAFIDKLNTYLDYVSFDERENGLTGTICKGIIRQCEEAIAERKSEIGIIQSLQNDYQTQRINLSNEVSMKNFFTDKDLKIIETLLRQLDYNNENIITTNLDDVVTEVDKHEELYQDAMRELDKLSQPQYSFSTELDNIYSLEEFKAYREPFDVGNFIRVGFEIHEDLYDNNYIKLRLISISHNPMIISDELSVEFSTMTKTLNTVSDLTFLLDKEFSSGGNSSSSGSSGSNGTFGNNDANVQMSNNMLNALLSTEMFGTAVKDVVLDSIKGNKGNFNSLFANSGVFDSLEAGQIKISGDCLFDKIKSNNYIQGESGSYLNLVDGTFEFAGGNLSYDGSNLVIGGYATDEKVNDSIQDLNNKWIGMEESLTEGTTVINGGCIQTGNIISQNYNGIISEPLNNTEGSIIMLSTGHFNFGGKLKWDGTELLMDGGGNFTGDITANSLTANKNGSIAGWEFDNNTFYKNSNLFANEEGMYLGNDGFSIKNMFMVDSDGHCIANSLNVYGGEINGSTIVSEKGYDITTITGGLVDIQLEQVLSLGGVGSREIEQLDNLSSSINIYNKLIDTYGYSYFKILPDGCAIRNQSSIWGSGETISTLDYIHSCILSSYNLEFYGKQGTTSSSYYYDGAVTLDRYGLSGSFFEKDISISEEIESYNFQIGKVLICSSAYEQLSFSGLSKRALYVGSDGTISASSSSSRYKQDISTDLDDIFNPHAIYNLPVCQFRYKEDFGGGNDSELYIGFIAEDVAKHYPPAARWNKEHTEVDTWEMSDMFPALVKLIQEQHQDIELLKEEIKELKIMGRLN